jgi:hypothetical protein
VGDFARFVFRRRLEATMRVLVAILMTLALASLAACADFAPTADSQAYQDYVSDQHLATGEVHLTHGW